MGLMHPIGIGSVLVGFANLVLFLVVGVEVPQWLPSPHEVGVGVRGGAEIGQLMVRAALDACAITLSLSSHGSTHTTASFT
jgi:hypothetical protein